MRLHTHTTLLHGINVSTAELASKLDICLFALFTVHYLVKHVILQGCCGYYDGLVVAVCPPRSEAGHTQRYVSSMMGVREGKRAARERREGEFRAC